MAPMTRLVAFVLIVMPWASTTVSAAAMHPHGLDSHAQQLARVVRHRRQVDSLKRGSSTGGDDSSSAVGDGSSSGDGNEGHVLRKRDFSGRATYYATGLGACGWRNDDSDYIVALNQAQYGSGGYCGKGITISYGGKTAHATIADECPGCPWGGLDMSPGLFQYFASLGAGVFYMSWSFDGQSGGDGSQNDVTTTTPQWSATSAWTTHSTTTWSPTPTPSPSPSSSANNSTGSSANDTNNALASPSSSGGPIGAASQADGTQSTQAYAEGGNLNTINQAVVNLAGLVVTGAQVAIQQVSR